MQEYPWPGQGEFVCEVPVGWHEAGQHLADLTSGGEWPCTQPALEQPVAEDLTICAAQWPPTQPAAEDDGKTGTVLDKLFDAHDAAMAEMSSKGELWRLQHQMADTALQQTSEAKHEEEKDPNEQHWPVFGSEVSAACLVDTGRTRQAQHAPIGTGTMPGYQAGRPEDRTKATQPHRVQTREDPSGRREGWTEELATTDSTRSMNSADSESDGSELLASCWPVPDNL